MINILKNISLSDKNWFKTGGNAKYFCEPSSVLEFQESLKFAKDNNLEIFVLGDGANVLISDDGFDGLVIKSNLKNINYEFLDNNRVYATAGSGLSIENLIEDCFKHNCIGLEEFSNIPGTVGGAVYINLHYFKFFISDFLVSATVINKITFEVFNVDKAWFNFSYDDSTLVNKEFYLIDATFEVKKVLDLEISFARGRKLEITRHRMSRYPNGHTCGSFFRNFHDHEVSLFSNGRKMIFVAYYLDKIGVKGELKFGGCQVSYQHANMLVNFDNATSTDIILVAKKMQSLVFENFGITPQPECILIGFKDYML